jgi:GTP cyclohydrolase II
MKHLFATPVAAPQSEHAVRVEHYLSAIAFPVSQTHLVVVQPADVRVGVVETRVEKSCFTEEVFGGDSQLMNLELQGRVAVGKDVGMEGVSVPAGRVSGVCEIADVLSHEYNGNFKLLIWAQKKVDSPHLCFIFMY